MKFRALEASDLEVPRIVFGAWAIGGWNWGGSDDEAAVRAIHTAIDLGMHAIDTAPVYGFGHSERVVARAIRDRRESVLLMTKVGLRWDDERGEFFFPATDSDGRALEVRRNLRAASVRDEVYASLARLETDYLDLVQLHWPDPQTPVAEAIGALLQLRAAGLVRAIGVSNFPPALIDDVFDALGDVPLASTQAKYSLVARATEHDVLPHCIQRGVGFMAYSPLEQGLLTGRVDASRVFGPDDGRSKRWTFTPTNRQRVNEALQRAVAPVAGRRGATIAQIVLAWTLAQPGVTAAIVGARSSEQVRENAAGGSLLLEPEELASIRRVFEGLELESSAGAPQPGLMQRVAGKFKRD